MLALLVFAGAVFGADDSLADACRAQALLGPEVWSRVIRIENEARLSRYAHIVHALVFELDGVLWFFTDADGTQSFSLQRGRLEEDKAGFGPLLREIEPGFARWSEIPAQLPSVAATGKLRNGCFIESVAALRERLARGGSAVHSQLLAYYVNTSGGTLGHTVLVSETGDRIEVFDPERRGEARFFPARLLADPLALARELTGDRVAKARLVPLEPPAAWTRVVANPAGADQDDAPRPLRRAVTIR